MAKGISGECLVNGDFCLIINSLIQQIFTKYLQCVRPMLGSEDNCS